MNDQNLFKIWKSSNQLTRFTIDYENLTREVKEKVAQLDSSIKKRNLLEIRLALLLMPLVLYLFFAVPYILFKTGVVLMFIWLLYVIYKLKVTRKDKLKETPLRTLKYQLRKEKEYLKKEVKLLNSVLYWYLLPPYIALGLMILSCYFHQEVEWSNSFLKGLLSENMIGHIVYMIFLTGLYIYIYKLNIKAIHTKLMPAIKDIEQIEEQLKK